MTVYEDPHAWLRPYFDRLRQHPAFATFAPSHQFGQLVDAIAADNATKAAEMREWSAAAQLGLVLHLSSAASQGHTSDAVELWRATKGDRELRCIGKHLPHGPVDLQVFDRDEFRRSQQCASAPEARAMAETWRKALVASGWALCSPPRSSV